MPDISVYDSISVSEDISPNGIIFGAELHTDANAASDPYGNEADAITGWTGVHLTGTGANVFESQSSVKNVGLYSLHADCNDTPINNALFYKDIGTDWNLIEGRRYKITFDWRHIGTGGNWVALFWEHSGLYPYDYQISSIINSDTTFESVSYTFVYDSYHRYFGFREKGAVNNGGVYVDNLSCVEVIDGHQVSVNDTVSVAENITNGPSDLACFSYSSINVTENIGVSEESFISVSDTINVTDYPFFYLLLEVVSYDSVVLAESVGTTFSVLSLSVHDSITLIDTVNTYVSGYLINGVIEISCVEQSLIFEAEAL